MSDMLHSCVYIRHSLFVSFVYVSFLLLFPVLNDCAVRRFSVYFFVLKCRSKYCVTQYITYFS